MPTFYGMGFGDSDSVRDAAQTAALRSKAQLEVGVPHFVLVFSTVHYNPDEYLPIIKKVLNTDRIVGCSTAGIIFSDNIATKGISVLSIRSTDMHFGMGSYSDLRGKDPLMCGSALAQACVADLGSQTRQVFIFFTDGKMENSSPMLKGIQQVLGNVFPLVGAGSSDDFHYQSTYQLCQGNVLTDSAAGFIVGGLGSVGVGARHGWRPLGKPRVIDGAKGNVIQTINGEKAFGLYEEYFGDEAVMFSNQQKSQTALLYPLGIYVEGSREYLLKNAVSIRNDGSIICQGDVEEGSEVHIMIGNKDSCVDAAYDAAMEAKDDLRGKDARFIFIIESMARLKLLGRAAHKEIGRVKEVFGDTVPIFGMYANGEICPLQTLDKFKKPIIQNESIVVVAVS